MWRRLICSPQQQQHHRYASSASSPTSSKDHDPFQYCIDLVRHRDRESYLCSLILPPGSRLAAFAIRAFNVELATVRKMVTNQNTALMRFKFWSSTLDKIFGLNSSKSTSEQNPIGPVPEHPVAEALEIVIREKKLSRKWLSELVDARIDRIDERRPFQSIKELEDFYQRTFGAIFFLLLEANGVRQVQADHAASHLGKALGIINGIRAINADPERNVNLLPLELLVHHRVSQHDVVKMALVKRRGRTMADEEGVGKRLRDMTFDLASQAHVHLEHARKLSIGDLGKKNDDRQIRIQLLDKTRLIFLPAAIVDHYLMILRKADFNILDSKIGSSYDWLALSLWWRKFKKMY